MLSIPSSFFSQTFLHSFSVVLGWWRIGAQVDLNWCFVRSWEGVCCVWDVSFSSHILLTGQSGLIWKLLFTITFNKASFTWITFVHFVLFHSLDFKTAGYMGLAFVTEEWWIWIWIWIWDFFYFFFSLSLVLSSHTRPILMLIQVVQTMNESPSFPWEIGRIMTSSYMFFLHLPEMVCRWQSPNGIYGGNALDIDGAV